MQRSRYFVRNKRKRYPLKLKGDASFFDEYGNEIPGEPQLLGTYGVATITGIAGKISQELIIAGNL